MADTIQWTLDYKQALENAKAENKFVFLDFFNPQWIGCKTMDAVTYPNPKVIDFLRNRIVSLQLKSDAMPYARDYNVKWTPNLLVIDADGKEHHRIVGFLPPVEFIAALLLGMGKANFHKGQHKEAIELFDAVLADYSHSGAAPEAAFYKGVATYKGTGNVDGLKQAYKDLQEKYPNSDWAKRAYPYWLLPWEYFGGAMGSEA